MFHLYSAFSTRFKGAVYKKIDKTNTKKKVKKKKLKVISRN